MPRWRVSDVCRSFPTFSFFLCVLIGRDALYFFFFLDSCRNGKDANAPGLLWLSPLHWASRLGHIEVMQVLLADKGIEVNRFRDDML